MGSGFSMAEGDWFEALFGFAEAEVTAESIGGKLRLADGRLHSGANGKSYAVGTFSTPSLGDLREEARKALLDCKGVELAGLRGEPRVENVTGDVAFFLSCSENRFATFQVASQFNCLEFVQPTITPEQGVTRYVHDKSQGPSSSIACGAGTVYRNYFAELRDESGEVVCGQRADRQIENLRDLDEALGGGESGKFFEVKGGYTLASEAGLEALKRKLDALGEQATDALRRKLRVGVQADTQVTSSGNSGQRLLADTSQVVTQVFSAACAVSYSQGTSLGLWEPLARLVLEASYEASLWVAVLRALEHQGKGGSRRIFLTALGGGVFGNSMDWITSALRRAVGNVAVASQLALEIRIISYRAPVDEQLKAVEKESAARSLEVAAACPPKLPPDLVVCKRPKCGLPAYKNLESNFCGVTCRKAGKASDPSTRKYELLPMVDGDGRFVAFHGTSLQVAESILKDGFQRSSDGCLGEGIYFATAGKAARFAKDRCKEAPAVLICSIRVRQPKLVPFDDKEWRAQGYDACRAFYTSLSPLPEWCVAAPEQISVIRIVDVEKEGWA